MAEIGGGPVQGFLGLQGHLAASAAVVAVPDEAFARLGVHGVDRSRGQPTARRDVDRDDFHPVKSRVFDVQTDSTTHRTWFGHPVGLVNLFGVELWERFSFYGMLTILGYYLYYSVTDDGLSLQKATAPGIVGAYGGLVYRSTVLSGWMAERVLGMERTVFYGGVVVIRGHISPAVLPGLFGAGVGLVLIALARKADPKNTLAGA